MTPDDLEREGWGLWCYDRHPNEDEEMPSENLDVSYSREHAEKRLRVKTGSMTLDQLAQALSLDNTDEPLSVRDINSLPIQHSSVYFRGVATSSVPYLARMRS